MARITFSDPLDAQNFLKGDVLNTGEIVVRVDGYSIETRPATWWRRAWYGARGLMRGAWWRIKCFAHDAACTVGEWLRRIVS